MKKIDIFLRAKGSGGFRYECSTNAYRTCREAKRSFCIRHSLDQSQVKCSFAKGGANVPKR